MRGMIFSKKSLFASVAAIVLVAGFPLQTFADITPTDNTTSTTSQSTAPAPPHVYTYDPNTGHWNTEEWQYDPTSNSYQKSTPHPTVEPTELTPTPNTQSSDTSSTDKSVDSTVSLNNNISSTATSGDSAVVKNTLGGSAASGNAAVDATLINSVNSIIGSGDNQEVAQFTKNIMGDVTGDIVLNPLLLKAMLEAKVPQSTNSTTSINSSTDNSINNNMNLNATSGSATVDSNTTAGNATSGSAAAVANVVNVLNSMIASQKSFVGTINIYGNLNGDILIAPDFIPQMIANNAANGTSNSDSTSGTQLSSKDTQSIINNISTAANSGAASVIGNSNAGSATTGKTNTNVVIFNLSGHEVVAKNSLLVFVNVLGKWVGVIVDAPAGATAAMISNDVTKSGYTPDMVVSSNSNAGITNSIAVSAKSGDAVVSKNTKAGNAVSGSATALVNVANVVGDQFSTSNWFGILFINVFQNWFGSFGIDTAAGNPLQPNTPKKPSKPIEFRPKPFALSNAMASLNAASSQQATNAKQSQKTKIATDNTQVKGASTAKDNKVIPTVDPKVSHQLPLYLRVSMAAGSLLVVGLSAIGLRRFIH